MLNSGEVPNLFQPDEYEAIIAAVRPKAKEHGIAEGDRSVDPPGLLHHDLSLSLSLSLSLCVCICVCVCVCVYMAYGDNEQMSMLQAVELL